MSKGKTLSFFEGEPMKFWKTGLKINYQPARDGHTPAMLIGIKRFVSKITPEELELLKRNYPPEKLEDLQAENNKAISYLIGIKSQIKKKLGENIAKMFNIKIAEDSAEIFEYLKVRKSYDLYRLLYNFSEATGFMYSIEENANGKSIDSETGEEITAKNIEAILKKQVHNGFWHGYLGGNDYIKEVLGESQKGT